MTIYDFCNLCTEEYTDCIVYDLTTDREVFKGTFRDVVFDEWGDYEISSFDLCPCDDGLVLFVFNIETEDEDYDDED